MRTPVSVLLLAPLLLAACDRPPTPGTATPPVAQAPQRIADWYVPPPPVRTFPTTRARIDGWIRREAIDSIRAHGWDLWESITRPAPGDTMPIWQTWYAGHEIFDSLGAPPGAGLRAVRRAPFERPVQFHQGRRITTAAAVGGIPVDFRERTFSFNRFTRSTARFIWTKRLYDLSVLADTNRAFTTRGTPIAAREVLTSSDSVDPASVVLKPVFQFIRGDSATVIPVWRGTRAAFTTDSLMPEVHTWKQGVWVDPTGRLVPGDTLPCVVNGIATRCPVHALSDFHVVPITAQDSANASDFGVTSGDFVGAGNLTDSTSVRAMIRPGNLALLMAMHVTGKEIVNWTWQTFWWSPDPTTSRHGAGRPPTIAAPWNHYDMDVAYFMARRNGQSWIAYNPYLETNLCAQDPSGACIAGQWTGIITNCMTCHRRARFAPDSTPAGTSPPYGPAQFIAPGDSALFAGGTKTDFLWSIPVRARVVGAGGKRSAP
ncbi:MAG: hypothetical protein MUE41_02910 [Gemmatimonadaceae bacterium]|nr:hypothetical protein [Gemmatimonadaceae bacterium]